MMNSTLGCRVTHMDTAKMIVQHISAVDSVGVQGVQDKCRRL